MVNHRINAKHIIILLCYAVVVPFILSILSVLTIFVTSWIVNEPVILFTTLFFLVHLWGYCFLITGIIFLVAGATSHGGHADAVAMGRSGIRTEAVMRDTKQDALQPRRRRFSRASLLISGVLLLILGLALLGIPLVVN